MMAVLEHRGVRSRIVQTDYSGEKIVSKDDPVCVAEYPSEIEAEMAVSVLDTEGIGSFISKDDCGGARPWLQPVTGVKLYVRELDAERAVRILREIEGGG
jgi:hypothetical protein